MTKSDQLLRNAQRISAARAATCLPPRQSTRTEPTHPVDTLAAAQRRARTG